MPLWVQVITSILAAMSPFVGLAGVWMGQRITRSNAKSQWLMDQQLKIYSDVLRAINEYSVWITDVSEWRKFGNQSFRDQSESTLDKQNKQIAGEFHSAYAIAPLFVSDESMRLLELAKPLFYYHSDPLANFEVEDLDNTFDALESARANRILRPRRLGQEVSICQISIALHSIGPGSTGDVEPCRKRST
jgi:hypothetical protein